MPPSHTEALGERNGSEQGRPTRRAPAGLRVALALLIGSFASLGVRVEAAQGGSLASTGSGGTCGSAGPTPGGAAASAPPNAPVTETASTSSGIGSTTSVTVIVPGVAVVLVDESGSPVAAETNTGETPSCADLFFVTTSTLGMTLQPAQPGQIRQAIDLGSSRAGSWHAGWNTLSTADAT